MRIEFTNPLALSLLVSIPIAVYLARRSLSNLSRGRASASVAVRAAVLLLMVLSLAGLRLKTTTRDLALIFLIDVSASVPQEQQKGGIDFINREMARAGPRDYVGVIAFAREPSVELAPTRKEVLGDWRLTEISANPQRDYTDIAAALRLAAALVPETAVGRFVLISDGNENLESAVEQARLLKASGVEVYAREMGTVNSRRERSGEVAVRELDAPERLAEGESFDLKVTIDSNRDTGARLRVFRNDSLVAERDVQLAASGENVFLLPQRNDQKGFYTYRAEIEAFNADGFVQNNAREAFSVVEGRPRTLYVYGDPTPSAGMARVLADGDFAADTRSAAGVPTTLAGLQNYDLVIFDNVPASAITGEQMRMIQSYVRDLGGGFIMIGGDQSFGPGGYYKTPVEETLPVSLDVRQKKHFPSLAIVLVIDKSGSMAGPKMQMTIEAASATVDFLSERDSLGVIAFDSQAQTVVRLAPVEDKRAITREIGSIQAVGGTSMYPGLKMAHEWLQESDARLKHIIVLSDGMSEAGDFPGIARAIREAGTTLTTVAVGEDADLQTMRFLANAGGGRSYAVDRADNLPRIFTREAFLASQSTIIEEPFVPKLVRGTQATAGVDWSAAPQLGGYVGTAERDSTKTPAITSLMSDKDDPVYATWQYGLGRAAAFTSDAKPRWAAGWMTWSGFGQFWTQLLRETVRHEGSAELVPRVEITAGRGRITVDAVTPQGEFLNDLRLQAHVVAPDLSSSDVTLEQTAAGRYEARFPAPRRGAYLVSVPGPAVSPAPGTGSVSSYSPEFDLVPTDEDLLRRLSEATGGRLMPLDARDPAAAEPGLSADQPETSSSISNEELFERNATRTRPREIWEALLLFAALLLPIDVGIRRVHVTREQLLQARDAIASRFARAPRSAAYATPVFLAQLKGARSRIQLRNRADGSASKASIAPPAQQTWTGAARPVGESSKERSSIEDSIGSRPADMEGRRASTNDAAPLSSRLLEAKRRRRE